MRYLMLMHIKQCGVQYKTEAPDLKTAKRFYWLTRLFFHPYEIRIIDTQQNYPLGLVVKKHECLKCRRYWKAVDKASREDEGDGE